MLRFFSGVRRDSAAFPGAVMKYLSRSPVFLLFCGLFQRLLRALRDWCCLFPVFVFFAGGQRLFHMRESGCLITSGSLHGPFQPFRITNRDFLPSQRTPSLSV